MKRNISILLLSLIIPLFLISCSNTSKINTTKESEENNSSINNGTSAENNTDSNIEKEESAKIYYYDAISDKIVYINKSIKYTGDNIVPTLIDELKKSPNSDIPPSISNDIVLNSYNIDNDKSTITLDFSSNFASNQNLGSRAESNAITAICNTFGSYFNIENVIITLDGNPYSSGHIYMNEGEAFKVNLSDSIELN